MSGLRGACVSLRARSLESEFGRVSFAEREFVWMNKEGGFMAEKGKRELIDTGTDKRYVRRDDKGRFDESDDQGRSLALAYEVPAAARDLVLVDGDRRVPLAPPGD